MDESERTGRHAAGEEVPPLQFALMTVAKAMLAAAVVVGTLIVGFSLPLLVDGTAPPRGPIQPRDSGAIVVEADVKDWEPIFPDAPINATQPDRRINVVKGGGVLIGQHNWIVRLKVARVVCGVFEPDEVHTLVHSPSQSGVTAPGQRFVLRLRRSLGKPKVIASSGRNSSRGLACFSLSEPVYEMISSSPGQL
jgi:hypothetical protein